MKSLEGADGFEHAPDGNVEAAIKELESRIIAASEIIDQLSAMYEEAQDNAERASIEEQLVGLRTDRNALETKVQEIRMRKYAAKLLSEEPS